MKVKEFQQFLLLNAGIAEHHSDWNWKEVSSPFARLYMVRAGAATIHLPSGVQKIEPGSLYLIPPFTLHGYECNGYLSLYYFHIYESLSSHNRILEEYDLPFRVEAGELECRLISRLLEINPDRDLHRYDPLSYDNNAFLQKNLRINLEVPFVKALETNGILSVLLSRFLAENSLKQHVSDGRIAKALNYIRKNIDEVINLDELAFHCCMSKDHFIRLFKKEIGETPARYVNSRKIEKVQLLLILTDYSVQNIAQMLSFNNLANFNRLFRQITGTTPSQYRTGSGSIRLTNTDSDYF